MDKSPLRKRARYQSPMKERWSLAQNDILLDEVYDYGVDLLADSESDCISDEEKDCDNISRNDKNEQMAILQSSISKETLKKMADNNWELEIRKTDIKDETTNWNSVFSTASSSANISSASVALATLKMLFVRVDELSAKEDHFEELSDEMILHIFHFLPKRVLTTAALVCKRWHSITQDESLWARMDLSCHQLRAGTLGHILSRQVMIMRLAQAEICYPPILPGCYAHSEDFRSRLLLLDLSMVNASCNTLVELFKRCNRLKKVSLEHVQINEKVLAALSLNNKDLEVINLAMVEGLNERGLKYILGSCSNIRELNLAWTYLNAVAIQYICSNLPKCLDRLNISGCRKLLSDKNILKLVTRCKNLRELDLSDCTNLTSDAITHITLLKDLNFLALSRCYQVSYSSLMQLKKIPSLLYLDVHGGYVDTAELRHIQENLGSHVQINKFKFSSVARPTVGTRRSSIWNMRVRD